MADFDYGTLLDVADALVKIAAVDTVNSVGLLRTAINRAYYAVYGTLRRRITEEGHVDCFNGQGRHADLADGCVDASKDFQGSGLKCDLSKIGVRLRYLIQQREKADYQWSFRQSPNAAHVKAIIVQARELHSWILQLSVVELQTVAHRVQQMGRRK